MIDLNPTYLEIVEDFLRTQKTAIKEDTDKLDFYQVKPCVLQRTLLKTNQPNKQTTKQNIKLILKQQEKTSQPNF